ncbi:MAG TPA: outer membrane beta-barrel protein [Bacteroidia bacterium]|nr:outer membrane beta-barrel protein [Bacteroidia bacterium]
MKKTLALVSGLFLFFSVQAQSFDIGARYSGMSNWLFNNNVSNEGAAEDYSASYSYCYGITAAYNFNEHISIETNFLMGVLTEGYNGSFGSNGYQTTMSPPYYFDNETYHATTTLNTIQIPIFFRFLSGNGAYAEIGPEIGIITDATYTATYAGGPASSSTYDVGSYFPNTYIGGVLAFGNNIRLHNALFLNINLRFSYDFTDIKGVDGLGQNLNNSDLYSGSKPYYSSPKATHAASAAFGVGIMYRLGHDF